MKFIIQKIVISLLILFLFGCGIDSLKSYEMAKKRAGTDYVVRVFHDWDDNRYIIIDKNGNIRELKYFSAMRSWEPKMSSDKVLFKIENIENIEIKKIKYEIKYNDNVSDK